MLGVRVDRERIIATFGAHGYVSGVNCGDAFDAEDRENVARWLIGQCLANLVSVGAIHGIVHKFADDWIEKFETPTIPH